MMLKNYYGKVLEQSSDLQTNACCTDDDIPNFVKTALSNIHDEVLARYYGCGLVAPEALTDCHILDLGSGSGRDCYALAQVVGEQGKIVGVDMTDEQLNVANKHIEYHRQKFGFAQSNVSFQKGYLEQLDKLNLNEQSFDVIVSNCVINLSTDKKAVLQQAYRLLKSGGEIYFSDVYADRRIPQSLVADPLLYGECLSGALYWSDFLNLAKSCGFLEPRLVSSRQITIDNDEIINRVNGINFYSATYRLFKVDNLESQGENYGQQVTYKGTIDNHKAQFNLDENNTFITNKPTNIDGNTWKILQQSRFKTHFSFNGNFDTHLGAFSNQNTAFPFTHSVSNKQTGGCC